MATPGTSDLVEQILAACAYHVSEVGSVAEQAGVRELILTQYLPAEPDAVSVSEWAERAGQGFSGRTTAGTEGLRRILDGVAFV